MATDDRLLEKVHDLSDLELAVLLCLISREHCLISTPAGAIADLVSELQLVCKYNNPPSPTHSPLFPSFVANGSIPRLVGSRKDIRSRGGCNQLLAHHNPRGLCLGATIQEPAVGHQQQPSTRRTLLLLLEPKITSLANEQSRATHCQLCHSQEPRPRPARHPDPGS